MGVHGRSNLIDIGSPQLPVFSSLFLYGLYVDQSLERGSVPHTKSVAAVARITSDHFAIVRTFPVNYFGVWMGVWSAANKGTNWLLFRNADGVAATGIINDQFDFVQARSYPKGHVEWLWMMAVDGQGFLLMTGGSPAGLQMALAQVDGDGTLIIWWTTIVALEFPKILVGLPNAHAWLVVDDKNQQSTLHILHRGQLASSRTWPETWTNMVAHGDLIALYRGSLAGRVKRLQICRVDENYQVVTLSEHQDSGVEGQTVASMPVLYEGIDVDTANGTLFYENVLGTPHRAEIRSLTPSGYVTTKEWGELVPAIPAGPHGGSDPRWFHIAPC